MVLFPILRHVGILPATATASAKKYCHSEFSRRYVQRLQQSFKSTTANANAATVGTVSATTTTASTTVTAASLLAWYSMRLETHPYTTKCITNGIIAGSGDVLCQVLVAIQQKKESILEHIDMFRTIRFTCIAMSWTAPLYHNWFNAIQNYTLHQKVFLDQIIFAPIFLTSVVAWVNLLEYDDTKKQSWDQIALNLKTTMPDVCFANWVLWIPAMYLNFTFAPTKYQLLVNNIVALPWNAYLSLKASDSTNNSTTTATTNNDDVLDANQK